MTATIPYQRDAPWPVFRCDMANSGGSSLPAAYGGDAPWFFQTGKGIFATPVIDATGTIFIGSADHNFYALNADGRERWRFTSGEIIDSAAALPADDPDTVLVPSGDGFLYRLNKETGRLIWQFDARVAPRASYNNWFEANVALGPDGTIYAGNTNFNYYALTPAGQLKWVYETDANAWSAAAFGPDGTIFWGSCDTFFHAVSPAGQRRWRRRTLGFIAASAAVGSDGTVYAGSFDSYFYALDPATGQVRWKFKTGDHIYGSAALLTANGATELIIFGATDGIVYALTADGRCRWQYDSGAPVRASVVIGRAPAGESGHIAYFGNGDGKLFALNTADGTRRWSYDTTGAGMALADRNDLNGSPALGQTGIYIGGEHGQLWYVPYDYPRHHPEDGRGATRPAADLPADVTALYYITPGGRAVPDLPAALPAATLICLKLVVRQDEQTIPARFFNLPFFQPAGALDVAIDPPLPFKTEVSGDGRYLYVIPDGFLAPNQTYTLSVSGRWYRGGLALGNLTIGGRAAGRFAQTFTFSAEPAAGALPLQVNADEVSAIELTRLAVPIPTMLPSLNQIGFDYMNWLLGAVAVTETHAVLWAVGAVHDEQGRPVVDPDTDFRLPLSGPVQDDAFILTNRAFKMAVTGIPIPFDIFQLRGRLAGDHHVHPGARAYAETAVLSIPTFGIPMVIAGLANQIWRKLVAMVTYITRPYPASGPANRRPAGVTVSAVAFVPAGRRQTGRVTAAIAVAAGHTYPAAQHLGAILLIDAGSAVVNLDYHHNLRQTADGAGNLSEVALTLPAGVRLPKSVTAIVILDVFPIYRQNLVLS